MKCFEFRMLYSSYSAVRWLVQPNTSTCYEAVLYSAHLARCIYDLGSKLLAFELDDFAECVFNSGIITLNKVAINELYC